jgi:hypothetical protein
MSNFVESITKLIKKDLEKGVKLKEAVLNAGFHHIDGTNTYIMGYGIYEDNALVIVIPD